MAIGDIPTAKWKVLLIARIAPFSFKESARACNKSSFRFACKDFEDLVPF
jgi:hypothetical protein